LAASFGSSLRREPRVRGAQDRAVLHVEREADGLPVVAARHKLAQDLDVVVLGVEEAFVEWLLERHHPPPRRRPQPSLASSSAALVKHVRVSALVQHTPTNASMADLPRVEAAWRNPGEPVARAERAGNPGDISNSDRDRV
jgi:hypothetical protein